DLLGAVAFDALNLIGHDKALYDGYTTKVLHQLKVIECTQELSLGNESCHLGLIGDGCFGNLVDGDIGTQNALVTILPEVGDETVALSIALEEGERGVITLLGGVAH